MHAHIQRRHLHKVVKVMRVKNGAHLETSQVQVVLWAGYGDPRGEQVSFSTSDFASLHLPFTFW